MPDRTLLIPLLPYCQNLQLQVSRVQTLTQQKPTNLSKTNPPFNRGENLNPKYPSSFLNPEIKPYTKYHYRPNLGVSFPIDTHKPKKAQTSQSKFHSSLLLLGPLNHQKNAKVSRLRLNSLGNLSSYKSPKYRFELKTKLKIRNNRLSDLEKAARIEEKARKGNGR